MKNDNEYMCSVTYAGFVPQTRNFNSPDYGSNIQHLKH